MGRKALSEAMKEDIRRRLRAGEGHRSIAINCGVAKSTVFKISKEPSLSGAPAVSTAAGAAAFEQESEEEEEENGGGGLDLALIAAGEEPEPGAERPEGKREEKPPPPPPPPKGAQWCVDQINQLKGMGVFLGAITKGIPLDHPRLEVLSVINPMAESAVRASAAELEPWLAKFAGYGGLWVCMFWLGLDAVGTYKDLLSLAPKAKEKAQGEKKAERAPEPPPPPPPPASSGEAWKASIQPAPDQGVRPHGVFTDNLRRSA
jgi:hypothetical protein